MSILSYPDKLLTSTLTQTPGYSLAWSTTYPLNNLKNTALSVKTRTNGISAINTTFRVDLGATVAVSCLAVLAHNFSFGATIRIRGYTNSGYGTMVTGADTKSTYIYPQTITSTEADDYPNNWVFAFSSAKSARYWQVDIIDTSNPWGYLEFGRVWFGEGTFEPSINISYGGSLGYENRDLTSESIGGVLYGESRVSKRVTAITFSELQGIEKQKALIMQKVLGKTGELLYVMDRNATAIDMALEAFPANIRTVSPLNYPYFSVNELPIELVEMVDSSTKMNWVAGGTPTDVKNRE